VLFVNSVIICLAQPVKLDPVDVSWQSDVDYLNIVPEHNNNITHIVLCENLESYWSGCESMKPVYPVLI
jgi:hypothetical protein